MSYPGILNHLTAKTIGKIMKEKKHGYCNRMLLGALPMAVIAALLIGCGGGGGGGGGGNTSTLYSGTFLDSAVEGLHYETATQSGVTDMNGTFYYMQGETIRFYMGDVMLGEAPAEEYMTPVDLVPGAADEMDPTVTNICRLLQTVDEDGDPQNGIYISAQTDQMMVGRHISFDMPIEDFEADENVTMMMDALDTLGGSYTGRMMTDPNVAQAHMRYTLNEMMGMMNGSGPQMDHGVFLDSAVQGLHYETATQSGVTDKEGGFTYMDGEIVRFHLGDVLIGEATGEPILTTVDMVPGAVDETDPMVTNIGRFLQTMDMDADPSNGIFIPDWVSDEMQDRHVDFNMPTEEFELNPDVTMLMDSIGALDPAYEGRVMVSAENAQSHMGETIEGMVNNGTMMNGDNNMPEAVDPISGDGHMNGGDSSNGGTMINGGNSSGGGMM